jgi:HlyD family secretion protein
LQLLQTVLHDHKVNTLKLAIAQKKLELMRVRHDAAQAQEQGEAKLDMAEIQYAMESERVGRLQQRVEACKVHAPQDGVVLYPQIRPTRGMTVRDGQLLLRLVEGTRFKLNVHVKLSVAQSLVTGQSVTVRIDAFPGRSFPGRISRMRVLAGKTPQASEALVAVRVDDPSGKLRMGMTGMVEFDLSQNRDAER